MRKLGQNFLYDTEILHRIIDASEISDEDTVVEIGPGPGALTMLLAERVKKVIAIEIDRKLYEKLMDKLRTSGVENVELHLADALRFDYGSVGPFTVVSNIPYQITTPLIFKLLEHRDRLRSMTLTVQKEVAERIAAPPGGKDYGVLSIMVQYLARAELKFPISRDAFRPAPKVDSACIKIDVYERPAVEVKNERLFFSLVKTAFSHRRKTLLNALKNEFPDIKEALAACDIDPGRRPETLSIADFARLSDEINLLRETS